jgi:hypothetical protein
MLDPGINVQGWPVVDPAGDRIGTAVRRYPDVAGGEGWVLVDTGRLGDEVLVPLLGVDTWDNKLAVRFYRSWVKEAPLARPGAVPEAMRRLVAHYRAVDPRVTRPIEPEVTAELPAADIAASLGVSAEQPAPAPVPEAVPRQPPRVDVRLERREAERVRIRKSVVTQPFSETVPVLREDVVIERIPVADADAEQEAADGPRQVSEAVHELVLHKEAPIAVKRVVPVERIRLRVVPVTDHVQVSPDAAPPLGQESPAP